MEPFEVVAWLRQYIADNLANHIANALLIGSVVSGRIYPKDCDLLVVLKPEYIEEAIPRIAQLRLDFQATFRVPLHVTRLTTQEIEETKEFLAEVVSRAHIDIYP